MSNTAYPKVNVYEYDDKVGVVAEIPGLDKKQLSVDVEDGVLTISGDKHSAFENEGAKVLRRELKQSSFKRQFELGDLLDGKNISANFKDGILSVSIPKIEPEKPKKHSVKIG
jgi:HSP20 family protein